MRILLAEDEDDLREVTVKRLKTEGFGVDGCRDGQEALEYLDAADYNLVILDIMMPRLDGLSVLRKMRSGGKSCSCSAFDREGCRFGPGPGAGCRGGRLSYKALRL